jgi:hypothetical protein
VIFQEAFKLLGMGRRIRRSSWDSGMYLFKGTAADVEIYQIYMYMRNGQGPNIFPYRISGNELFAEDWEEV